MPSVVPSRRRAICDLSTANRGTRCRDGRARPAEWTSLPTSLTAQVGWRSRRRLASPAFPSAWAWAMIGGYGIRPCRSVGRIEVAWVAEAPLAHHPDRRLVAVRVLPDRKAPEEIYDPEGLPRGYEPPHDLRVKVRRADEERERLPAAALAGAPASTRAMGTRGTRSGRSNGSWRFFARSEMTATPASASAADSPPSATGTNRSCARASTRSDIVETLLPCATSALAVRC